MGQLFGSEGVPEGIEGLPEGSGGLTGGGGDRHTDGRTDGRTDVRNFSPFYRTLSPVGAAAQKGYTLHAGCLDGSFGQIKKPTQCSHL